MPSMHVLAYDDDGNHQSMYVDRDSLSDDDASKIGHYWNAVGYEIGYDSNDKNTFANMGDMTITIDGEEWHLEDDDDWLEYWGEQGEIEWDAIYEEQ